MINIIKNRRIKYKNFNYFNNFKKLKKYNKKIMKRIYQRNYLKY